MATKSAYVLIQLGYATYGEGDDAESAREDARQWLDSPSDADEVPVCETRGQIRGANLNHGDLVIVSRDVADELGEGQ